MQWGRRQTSPENLVEMARLLVARRGSGLRVEEVSDSVDGVANESGVLLPGGGAMLGGPRFEEWLATPPLCKTQQTLRLRPPRAA